MGGVLSCLSTSEAETASLAVRLGAGLGPGDCVLLDGPIGAGKTHFCRALIRSLLAQEEDIPSPTFTLVQSYDGVSGPIWHADLYRLGHVDEVMELGLDEAFGSAICLVEWPDRLGGLAPGDALRVGLAPEGGTGDRRRVTFTWDDPKWDARLDFLK